MSKRQIAISYRNDARKPITIVIEPSAARHIAAPGQQVFIVAEGPSTGELELEDAGSEMIVYGWEGSRVAVVDRFDPALVTTHMTASHKSPRTDRPIEWEAMDDGDNPFEATVDGQRWKVRRNHPREPFRFSLLVDGAVVEHFTPWPAAWKQPVDEANKHEAEREREAFERLKNLKP